MSSRKDTKEKKFKLIYVIVFSIILFCIAYVLLPSNSDIANNIQNENIQTNTIIETNASIGIEDIPKYSGQIFITINNDNPDFSEEDFKLNEDIYSNLVEEKVRNGNDKN